MHGGREAPAPFNPTAIHRPTDRPTYQGPECAGRRGRDGGGALGVVDERQLAEAATRAVLPDLGVVDEDLLGVGWGLGGHDV